MSENQKIFGIYSDGPVSGREGNFYRMIHLFSSRGRVEEETMKKVFHQNFQSDYSDVVFETKDDLNKFLYHLTQEEDVQSICIMSVEEYNQYSESVFKKAELLRVIEENAFCIENMDFTPKRGLFGKMFS